MNAVRSFVARPELKATEHRLTTTVGNVDYAVVCVVPNVTYANLDQAFATKLIEDYLWTNMMRTIENHLRKNLTHA